jgi:quercetin dioxygenase-like cupin family protein
VARDASPSHGKRFTDIEHCETSPISPRNVFARRVGIATLVVVLLYYLLTYKTMRGVVTAATAASAVRRIRDFDAVRATAQRRVAAATEKGSDAALWNPATRETWYMVDDAAASDGEQWEMYERLEHSGAVALRHTHPYQTERIAVISGAVDVFIGNERRTMRGGDYVLVPAGVSHGLTNSHGDDVLMHVVYAPRLADMGAFFRALARMALRGDLSSKGVPSVLHAALLWRAFPGISGFTWLPHIVQDALTMLLAPIADALGYTLE